VQNLRFSVSGRLWVALTTALLLGSLTALSGCGSDGGSQPAAGEAQAEPQQAAPPKGVAPPADHRMAKVTLGMPVSEVETIMGSPTHQKSYMTGKAFVPFNYGNDSGSRVEYAYKGEGRIIFAVPRWGGGLKVERIDYDPTEAGD